MIDNSTPLRFHWMLPKGGEVALQGKHTPTEVVRSRVRSTLPDSPAVQPDLPGWSHFAQRAQNAGIDSLLISFSRYEPDPMLVAGALGQVVDQLGFIIAFRSGLMQPAAFVQQANTLSALLNGRVSFNTVAGSSLEEQHSYGDFLAHDDRYCRAGEFLQVCNSFWENRGPIEFEGKHYRVKGGRILTPFVHPKRTMPEIFVSGHSESALHLASSQSSCWLRVIDTPEKLAPMVAKMRAQGIEVCLRLGIICRPTRTEAIEVIDEILEFTHSSEEMLNIPKREDSQMYREAATAPENAWLGDNIWAGFKPFYGPVWTTLIGTPTELAQAFLAYKRIGISQFIVSGWPEVDEVRIFGEEILPLVRELENAVVA